MQVYSYGDIVEQWFDIDTGVIDTMTIPGLYYDMKEVDQYVENLEAHIKRLLEIIKVYER